MPSQEAELPHTEHTSPRCSQRSSDREHSALDGHLLIPHFLSGPKMVQDKLSLTPDSPVGGRVRTAHADANGV